MAYQKKVWPQLKNSMEKIKELLIYGNGGHAKVVADIARLNGYNKIRFIDDSSNNLKFSENLPRIDIIIAIGNNKIREFLQNKVLNLGFNVISLIHPSAIISPSAKIARGAVIMPLAIINADAKIEDGVIINSSSVIEHDCICLSFSHISPSATLAGGIKIGKRTQIGANSVIKECIKICDDVLIGAGSVVVNDIEESGIYAGNPAKFLKRDIK